MGELCASVKNNFLLVLVKCGSSITLEKIFLTWFLMNFDLSAIMFMSLPVCKKFRSFSLEYRLLAVKRLTGLLKCTKIIIHAITQTIMYISFKLGGWLFFVPFSSSLSLFIVCYPPLLTFQLDCLLKLSVVVSLQMRKSQYWMDKSY